jgi:hypothetical protein
MIAVTRDTGLGQTGLQRRQVQPGYRLVGHDDRPPLRQHRRDEGAGA